MAVRLWSPTTNAQSYLKRSLWSNVPEHTVCGWFKHHAFRTGTDYQGVFTRYTRDNNAWGVVGGASSAGTGLKLDMESGADITLIPAGVLIYGQWIWFGWTTKTGTNTNTFMAYVPGHGWKRGSVSITYTHSSWTDRYADMYLGNWGPADWDPANCALRDFRVWDSWMSENDLRAEFYASAPRSKNGLYAWYQLKGKDDYGDYSGNGNDIDTISGEFFTEADPWQVHRRSKSFSLPKLVASIGAAPTGPQITNVTDGTDAIFLSGQTGILTIGSGFGT